MIGDTKADATIPFIAGSPAAACEGDGPSRHYHASTISILYVDDHDADAERLSAALTACRDFRIEVDQVSCPEEARRLWDCGLYDIAIFDVWLGNGTSVELLVDLTEEAASRPVIMLSNLPHAEARAIAGDSADLMVHSKDDLTPTALAVTLGSALALSQRIAVMLHA